VGEEENKKGDEERREDEAPFTSCMFVQSTKLHGVTSHYTTVLALPAMTQLLLCLSPV